MIKIPIDLAATIYLIISVCILFMWFILEKKTKYIRIKKEDTFWICPLCFYEYVDSRSKDISRCPRCKTLHKKGEK
ncbi:MAG: hypothetical protein NC917_00130 [Candidatus Omnitrophica bacterium]|nr:hypothetical protein [Candidatus Omnitrophota bacterium]MCM8809147.1 hypothetical protein [Candidatus Omnitrophota bacterium]MCM8810046.1 hypothetical protein [Candidatus Omnitrophota bacterium]